MTSTIHHREKQGAFTLVETVLAIGIIAVIAIPTFALMAVGSNLNLESQQAVFMSQISDQIGREVTQADFSDLPDPYPLFIFDSAGIRLTDPDSPDRFYIARVTVDKSASLPGSPMPSGNLARVVIDIVPDRSGSGAPAADLFATDADGNRTAPEAIRHSLLISRND